MTDRVKTGTHTGMPQPGPILCLAITPAVQRTQFLSNLKAGAVNRIARTVVTASGKGVNVALALARLGAPVRLAGLRGGDSGAYIAREMERLGIAARWLEVPAPTRHCHTLVDASSGQVTELVEEAVPPLPETWTQFLHLVQHELPGCNWLAVSGALPPGSPAHAMADLCRMARAAGVELCLDTQGPPLRESLVHHPALVKINREELLGSVKPVAPRIDTLPEAAGWLREHGANTLLVTDGAHPAHLFTAEGITTLDIPAVPVVNPIGSGDCVTAGLLAGLQRGWSLLESARFGLACGSANAETETPADLDPARALQLAGH